MTRLRIPYKPRDVFKPFHDRQERWACIVAHRRCGKTVACINDLVRRCLENKRERPRYGLISPFLSQSKTNAWDYLKAYSAPLLAYGATFNESELRVDFPNGGRVRLYGADNYQALRGGYFDGIVIDEPSQISPAVYTEVLRPALSDRNGWAVWIGTPCGKNEFWEISEKARQSSEWFHLDLKASETGLIPQSELDDALEQMGYDRYQQEYENSFEAAIMGAYFGREMSDAQREGRIIESLPLLDTEIHTAWDFGNGANMAVWAFQIGRDGPHVVDFISVSGYYFLDYLKEIKERHYTGTCYVPHDAKVPSFETGRTRIETMLAEGVKPLLVADHRVEDRIHAAKLTIPKCRFDGGRCASGLEALRQYKQEWDDKARVFKNTPKHDWASHPADAFGYMAMAWREHIQPEIDRTAPKQMRGLNEITMDEYIFAETGGYEKRDRV